MINVTHTRDAMRTGTQTVEHMDATSALINLLTFYAKANRPRVGTGMDQISIADGPSLQGLITYTPADQNDYGWDRMHRACTLLQMMTQGCVDRWRGVILDITLETVRKAAAYQAGERTTVVPTEDSYASYEAILGFIVQWVLGRTLLVPTGTPDEVAASLLAMECELTDGTPFNKTLKDLLGS